MFFVSCNNPPENKVKPKEKKTEVSQVESKQISPEDKCISLVKSIPEVGMLGIKIQLTTKNLNHLTLWVAADPSETKIKYYWVKAGEDNGYNIVTHLNFYVNPQSEEILYYDIVNDTLTSLEFWRNTLKD